MSLSRVAERVNWILMRSPYRFVRKAAARSANRKAITQRRAAFSGIELDEIQRQAVFCLTQYGHASAEGIVDSRLLDAAYARALGKVHAEGVKEGVRLNSGKDFWERLLDEDLTEDGRQPASSPFVQLAIEERVLAVASAYLNDAPMLDYIYLLHSTHKPGPLKVSQLWHKDYDDTQVLKLFVYLTDCETDEDGPFTFVPADVSKTIPFGIHSHRTDGEVGLQNLAKPPTVMKAPKLTAFFVDTSRCYHMGSRVAPGHERLLYMGTFTTFPKFNGRPTNYYKIDVTVSDRQRVALTYG